MSRAASARWEAVRADADTFQWSERQTAGRIEARRAVDTLLKFMENHRDEVVVIVAGYTDETVYTCSNAMLKALGAHIDTVPHGRTPGNARLARQLLETMVTHQARRPAAPDRPGVDDPRTLLPEDLPSPPL